MQTDNREVHCMFILRGSKCQRQIHDVDNFETAEVAS
jgi:hypothetical protein